MRATWEAFEFTLVALLQIEVANTSYGAAKAGHTSTVTIGDCDDGLIIPLHCNCPSD